MVKFCFFLVLGTEFLNIIYMSFPFKIHFEEIFNQNDKKFTSTHPSKKSYFQKGQITLWVSPPSNSKGPWSEYVKPFSQDNKPISASMLTSEISKYMLMSRHQSIRQNHCSIKAANKYFHVVTTFS